MVKCALDPLIRVPSPVIVATGTGQVGEGLENTWGLEEDDEEEEMADVTEQKMKDGNVSVILSVHQHQNSKAQL